MMVALPTPTPLPAPLAKVQAAESGTETLLDHEGERRLRTRRSRLETPYCGLSSVEIWGTLCLLVAISVPFLVAGLCHEAGYKAYANLVAFSLLTIGIIGYLLSPLAPTEPEPTANHEAQKESGVFSEAEKLMDEARHDAEEFKKTFSAARDTIRDTAAEWLSCHGWRQYCGDLCDPMMPYLKSALAFNIQLATGWAAVKQLKVLVKAVCILEQLAIPQSLCRACPLSTHIQSLFMTGSQPAVGCSNSDGHLHDRPTLGYGHLDAGRCPTVRLVHEVRVKGLPNISLLNTST